MKRWTIVLAVVAVAFIATGCKCADDGWRDCEGKVRSCCGNPAAPNCPSNKKMDAKVCPMMDKDGKACPVQQTAPMAAEKAQ